MTTFLMNGRLSRTAPVGLLAAALVAACGDDKAGTNPGTDAGTSPGDGGTAFPAAVADQAIATYKTLVHRTYQLSLDDAEKLKTSHRRLRRRAGRDQAGGGQAGLVA